MRNLLYLQLENERRIYANLVKEGRKDAIAQIVLSRVSKEINTLERLVNDEQKTRQESNEPRLTSRFVRYVCEAVYRLRHYKDGWNYSIPEVPTSPVLQAQAGTQ